MRAFARSRSFGISIARRAEPRGRCGTQVVCGGSLPRQANGHWVTAVHAVVCDLWRFKGTKRLLRGALRQLLTSSGRRAAERGGFVAVCGAKKNAQQERLTSRSCERRERKRFIGLAARSASHSLSLGLKKAADNGLTPGLDPGSAGCSIIKAWGPSHGLGAWRGVTAGCTRQAAINGAR